MFTFTSYGAGCLISSTCEVRFQHDYIVSVCSYAEGTRFSQLELKGDDA